MTTRFTAALSISSATALGALVFATPALAQEMTYDERGYEYAQPAPAAAAIPRAAPIQYRQEAVVQPLPARAQPVRYIKDRAGADYQVNYSAPRVAAAPKYHAPAARQVVHHAPAPVQRHAAPQHGAGYQGHYPGHQGSQPAFDRTAWLDECVDRVSGGRHDRRGGNGNVIGGLVGAAAGGLIGNRVAGRGDRLAGGLIGAGVGGLAGLAVGAAIDGKKRGRDGDAYAYCEDYLSRYSGGGHGYGYQHHGYAYQYARPMMLVPVWVQVPQRAVTREVVTYEYVDTEVVEYETVPARRVIKRAPAPRATKRIRVQKSKPVRYRKGK